MNTNLHGMNLRLIGRQFYFYYSAGSISRGDAEMITSADNSLYETTPPVQRDLGACSIILVYWAIHNHLPLITIV